jgi:hypothetical protein
MRFRWLSRVPLVIAMGLLGATPPHAITRNWTGAIDTEFNTLGNWSPSTSPWNTGDIVAIDTSAGNVATLSTNSAVTLGGLNLGLNASGSLAVNGGSLNVNGAIEMALAANSVNYLTMTGGTLNQVGYVYTGVPSSGNGMQHWGYTGTPNETHFLFSGTSHCAS